MALPPIAAASASLAQLATQLRAETVPSPINGNPLPVPGAPRTGFSDLIRNGLAIVTHAQDVSSADHRAFAAGAPNAPSLAQTMLAGQKSNIAFQEMIGIRNELARGYETLITMPV